MFALEIINALNKGNGILAGVNARILGERSFGPDNQEGRGVDALSALSGFGRQEAAIAINTAASSIDAVRETLRLELRALGCNEGLSSLKPNTKKDMHHIPSQKQILDLHHIFFCIGL